MASYRIFIQLFAVLTALALSSCRNGRADLPQGGWDSAVYNSLSTLLSENGSGSPDYDPECRPYAVFDFDNTTIINDISMTLMIYQAENLRYAFSPEKAFDAFTAWLPDLDTVMTGPGLSVREIGNDLAADYVYLRARLDSGSALSEVREMPEYLDLRAKLMALNEGVENTFDYGTWCLWMPSLFTGMTYDELTALTKESVDYWMSSGRIWTEEWKSPDGKAEVSVQKGLVLPGDRENLYKALRGNGIDVYVCSASLETVVEAMACSPEYGLCVPPENVFGIRLTGERIVGGGFVPGYDQTFMDGKVACIRKLIAPRHGGKDPVLVAGDSSGDYQMLTSFEGMKLGLIFDRGSSSSLRTLIDKVQSTDGSPYAVQPVRLND